MFFRVLSAAALLATLSAQNRPRLPGEDWIPLFNGKDLSGWTQIGHEKWDVEDGTIHGIALHRH